MHTNQSALTWRVAGLCISSFLFSACGSHSTESPDIFLTTVRRYADTMIAEGRDRYGTEHSPLFAVALDRTTLRVPEGPALEALMAIPREEWGIRSHDRMVQARHRRDHRSFLS